MARKQKDKIVRVQFSKEKIIMFGNSYESWERQLEEYLRILRQHNELISVGQASVSVSDNAWVSWGGLKWCSEENMQHQFNREGCQSSEEDNPNPRNYNEMRFYSDVTIAEKVNKLITKYKK
ncbi:spore protein H [Bacillus cereus group sp. BfR-BA-01363]|uniref:spore protein H n=1 Tax=Bacillus cereus group sp. BfR-BA-01363 TaxID=3094882 RepID=UPI0029C53A63|nr:spore protein H [Bacillus cereus group sp. BfR-BA-01363]MDX5853642.1 spore protein H [Bacillus cereus group sp. BfR-BA-01363]